MVGGTHSKPHGSISRQQEMHSVPRTVNGEAEWGRGRAGRGCNGAEGGWQWGRGGWVGPGRGWEWRQRLLLYPITFADPIYQQRAAQGFTSDFAGVVPGSPIAVAGAFPRERG